MWLEDDRSTVIGASAFIKVQAKSDARPGEEPVWFRLSAAAVVARIGQLRGADGQRPTR
jgi:hypothetical protein